MTMTLVTVTGLEPGQTTKQDAEFYATDRLPADTVFKVLLVERTPSL